MSRLVDALTLLDLLSTRTVYPLLDLAEHLGVTVRSVQRIRDDLEYAGYRIETVMGPGGGLRLVNTANIHPLAFTQDEIHHIRRAIETVLISKETTFSNEFVEALSKLYHQFDQSGSHVAVSAFRSVKLNVDAQLYQSNIECIEQAIQKRCRIAFDYHKNQRSSKHYVFEPYELMLVDQIWYVHGYVKFGRQLSLRVSRLGVVEMLDEQYSVEKDFSSRNKMTDFGFKINPVHLKILVTDRDYFSEYIWGDDQHITWIDDRSYQLEVTFPNEFVAKSFLLEGGSSMRVLEPEAFVSWICDESKKIMENYM